MHVLYTGMTGAGKTTMAQEMARAMKRRGYITIVLDPIGDPLWAADMQTADREVFLEAVMRARSCACFVDESGEMVGQYEKQMFWLATRARHLGHSCHFITQRPAQLNPTVRDNCEMLYCFRVGLDDAFTLAKDWGKPELKTANSLERFECFATTRFEETRRLKLSLTT